eukprot:TRINITY_DN3020_c0_g1_i1.p1 TRINITY_DN3020_c0_g1~~TRINITY_DN3020_c0_g1_i1.p1  ORF type:complete len:276 (+),score=75.34 TRINITY_DN3020_c0_g1_i1:51-878(+)
MLIKEYRIPMPLSVEEYRIAQLFMVAKFSRERTTKGEGIEIVANEPYSDENGSGQFTHKIIHVGSHLPYWAKSMLPATAVVEEKAWNAYPYVKTVYTCPFFGERFSVVSETRYFDDDGQQENVHNLKAEDLAQRQVEFVDIANEQVDPAYYKKEEDPTLYHSEKGNRGPLAKDWTKTQTPRMCIYKITYVEFKMWGVQTKAEQWIQKSMVRDVLLLGHKQAFCWMDEWFGLTMDDIRKYEQETKEYLQKMINGGTTSPTASPAASPAPTKEEATA